MDDVPLEYLVLGCTIPAHRLQRAAGYLVGEHHAAAGPGQVGVGLDAVVTHCAPPLPPRWPRWRSRRTAAWNAGSRSRCSRRGCLRPAPPPQGAHEPPLHHVVDALQHVHERRVVHGGHVVIGLRHALSSLTLAAQRREVRFSTWMCHMTSSSVPRNLFQPSFMCGPPFSSRGHPMPKASFKGAGPLTAREETYRRALDGSTRKGGRRRFSSSARLRGDAVNEPFRAMLESPFRDHEKPRKWQLNTAFRGLIIKYGIT